MSLASLDAPKTSPEFLKLWTHAAEAVAGTTKARPKQPVRPAAGYRHVLALRFVLTNLAAFALAAAATAQGWVTYIVFGDSSGLTAAIVALFLVGLTVAGWRIWEVSRALNATENPARTDAARTDAARPGVDWIRRYVARTAARDSGARATAGALLQSRLVGRIALVRHIANALVLLGLIGTVMGFIIALSGITAEAVSDPNAIGPMVGTLLDGMGTALFTTLAGAICNLWLMINFHMLAGGTAKLVAGVIEAAEDSAQGAR